MHRSRQFFLGQFAHAAVHQHVLEGRRNHIGGVESWGWGNSWDRISDKYGSLRPAVFLQPFEIARARWASRILSTTRRPRSICRPGPVRIVVLRLSRGKLCWRLAYCHLGRRLIGRALCSGRRPRQKHGAGHRSPRCADDFLQALLDADTDRMAADLGVWFHLPPATICSLCTAPIGRGSASHFHVT